MKAIHFIFFIINGGLVALGVYDFTTYTSKVAKYNETHTGVSSMSNVTLGQYLELSSFTDYLKIGLGAWFLFALVHIIVKNMNKDNTAARG